MINTETIKKRCIRKVLLNTKTTPVLEMEKQLAKILIASGHSRNPQPTSIIIELANELIEDTGMETKLIEWRKKHQPNHKTNNKLTY